MTMFDTFEDSPPQLCLFLLVLKPTQFLQQFPQKDAILSLSFEQALVYLQP